VNKWEDYCFCILVFALVCTCVLAQCLAPVLVPDSGKISGAANVSTAVPLPADAVINR
jgi:hypothetical protein